MKSIEAIEITDARGRADELSAVERSRLRVEMTRRALHDLLSNVEIITTMSRELESILEEAIDRVEVLAETEDDEVEEF